MQHVLVVVVVVLALLHQVRPHVGAQGIEENHSTNSELEVYSAQVTLWILVLVTLLNKLYNYIYTLLPSRWQGPAGSA